MNTMHITCTAIILLTAAASTGRCQVALSIDLNGALHWTHPEAQHVVTASDSLVGPWVIRPDIIYHDGDRHWTQPSREGSAQFYRLVTGHQFYDEFTGSYGPWTDWWADPEDSAKWMLSYDGALRIRYDPGTSATIGRTIFLPPDGGTHYGDGTLSLDILDWNKVAIRQTIGVIARLQDWGYIGRINFNDPDFGGRASLAISLANPLVRIPLDVDPEKRYRLVFSFVGPDLHLSLFDLGDLTRAVASVAAHDDTRSAPGQVGIWVNANFGESGMDTIVDNFLVTATSP